MAQSTIFTNIKSIVGAHKPGCRKVAGAGMKDAGIIEDAWLFVRDGKIAAFGRMKDLDAGQLDPSGEAELTDLSGRMVIPAWCDSHTHIVFPVSREGEFVDRIHGLTYVEIAERGGGILNSARKMAEADEDSLFNGACKRINEIIGFGTGAVEIKSGYGLSVESELKMLRVIKRLKEWSPIPVRATFLGAHAIPVELKDNRAEYIRLITEEMLPVIADEGLADYNDVFCDKGFFTVEETETILEAGLRYGLQPKIHANELDRSGGIQTGVKYNALSVDHLEFTGPDEISTLLDSETMPTLLPSTAFFLRLEYAPARNMIDAGLPVAVATDYNPGSSPSGNMPFVVSLSCIHMQMDPEEAINAATINGAYAMGLDDRLGSITEGKDASFIVTKEIPSLAYIPYAFGSDHIGQVYINGKKNT